MAQPPASPTSTPVLTTTSATPPTASMSVKRKKVKSNIGVQRSMTGKDNNLRTPKSSKRNTRSFYLRKDSTDALATKQYVYESNVSTNNIGTRFWHTMVSTGKSLIVYGGHNGSSALNKLDSFNFSTSQWSEMSAEKVPVRFQHSALFFADKIYVFGGCADASSVPTNSFFSISLNGEVQEIETTGNRPTARRGHVAVLHGTTMYIMFGSSEISPLRDMYTFDFINKNWNSVEQKGEIPSERAFHSACVIGGAPGGDRILVFGGRDKSGGDLGDFYSFDIATSTWSKVAPKGSILPPAKNGHTLISVQQDILLFGGNETALALEIFKYSVKDNSWDLVKHDQNSGSSRKWHCAVEEAGKIWIYGGKSEKSSNLDYVEPVVSFPSSAEEGNEAPLTQRADWEAIAMKKYPEILAFREKNRGLLELQSYGKSNVVSRTDDKSQLSAKLVTQLIMEFMHDCGYKKTLKSIEKESGINFVAQTPQENGLKVVLDLTERLLKGSPALSAEINSHKWSWENDPIDPPIRDFDHLVDFSTISDLDRNLSDNIWEDKKSNFFINNNNKNTSNNSNNSNNNNVSDGSSINVAIPTSGTLNCVVLHFVSQSSRDFKRSILWGHKLWSSSEILLRKLIEIYQIPPTSPVSRSDGKFLRKSVLNSLKFWMEECPHDFQSESMKTGFHMFLDVVELGRTGVKSNVSGGAKEAVVKEFKSIEKKREKYITKKKDLYSFHYDKNVPPKDPIVPKTLFSSTLSIDDIDIIELCRQLSLHSFHLFGNIPIHEFVSCGWSREPLVAVPQFVSKTDKCPTITNAMVFWHRLKWWVQHIIREGTKDSEKGRTKVFTRLGAICETLYELLSFDCLSAIIQGMAAESKQKQGTTSKTNLVQVWDAGWAKNSEAMIDIINNQIIPSIYGKEYDRIIEERAKREPLVPLLSQELSKIEKAVEGELDFISNEVCNIGKIGKLYQKLMRLKLLQGCRYNLLPIHQIQILFTQFPSESPKI